MQASYPAAVAAQAPPAKSPPRLAVGRDEPVLSPNLSPPYQSLVCRLTPGRGSRVATFQGVQTYAARDAAAGAWLDAYWFTDQFGASFGLLAPPDPTHPKTGRLVAALFGGAPTEADYNRAIGQTVIVTPEQ